MRGFLPSGGPLLSRGSRPEADPQHQLCGFRMMPQMRPCADRCRAVLKVSRAGLTSRWFRLYGGTRTQFLEIARDDRLTFLDTFIHHHELAVSRAQLDHSLLRGITGSDDVDEFFNLVRADRGLRHEQRIGPITDVHAGADILPWQQR